MLLDDVAQALEEAGIPCRRTVFLNPPQSGSFAVWGDAVSSGGADLRCTRRAHTATLSLCENQGSDADGVAVCDAVLDSLIGAMSDGWRRAERTWDNENKVYVTDYTFEFIEKVRIV